jgi:hypothetical protein
MRGAAISPAGKKIQGNCQTGKAFAVERGTYHWGSKLQATTVNRFEFLGIL